MDREYFYGAIDLADAIHLSQSKTTSGERLKEARERRGMTQKDLAEAIGVVQQVISRFETGSQITDKQGHKLAEVLEIGFDWLMEGDERNKFFPVDEKMIDWLKNHEDVRREIWNKMEGNL